MVRIRNSPGPTGENHENLRGENQFLSGIESHTSDGILFNNPVMFSGLNVILFIILLYSSISCV
jgi:hypothetical protein